ncbi:putative ribonuclease H-like domain-containing protein [Tanacetum coccineum]
MRPFGCLVTILNTIDHLGKFDRKADEGFFVGYSINRSKPNWIFDIDALTKSMNYKPVVVGNQSNGNEGTKACDDVGGDSSKDSECSDQEKEDNVNITNNVNAASTNEVNDVGAKTSKKLPDDPNMPEFKDIVYSDDDEDVGAEADMNNLDVFMPISPIPTTRIHKDHPVEQIIRDLNSAPQTRRMTKNLEEHGLFSSVQQRTNHKDFQNCLFACFLSQEEPKKTLADLPNKRGIVIKNKTRLVAQGYTQEEGIDYDEVFALIARTEAIRLKRKSMFVNHQDFKIQTSLTEYTKLKKVLYGLHQAPRAWYETLSTYLFDNGFQRGKIDKTLFIRRDKDDILVVQVYVDDIIFGSIKKSLCTEFEKMMHKKFQISSMGELTFFLGLQLKQKKDGIFISQDKYMTKILKKFGFTDVKTATTPMETQKLFLNDKYGEEVDVYLYRSMIGSFMYLTCSRPDIMFAVCACARYQVNPKISHLHAVKKELKRSTIIGPLTVVANSTTEAEYVAASSCYGQNGIGVNAGDSKLMLLGINLLLLEKVNAARHKLTTALRFLAKPAESEGFEQIVDFLNANPIKYALKINPTIYTSCIEQLWATAKVKTVNGEVQLQALVDGKKIIVTEASIRRDLQLNDEEGTDCLPNATIFEELTRMGYDKLSQKLTFYKALFSPQWKFLIHTILQCLSAKTTAWNEFSSTMAFVIIFLATNQKFNFSKYIFESMVKNLDNAGKFLMYLRFVQVFLEKQLKGMQSHKRIYVTPSYTKKIFGNMRRVGKGFLKGHSTDPQHTPTIIQPSTSQPQLKQRSRRPKRKYNEIPQSSGPTYNVADEATYEERDDSLVRAATTASSLEAEQDKGRQETIGDTIAQTRSENVSKLSNDPLLAKENKRGSRTHKLKRLYKVDRSARIVSSNEASLGDQEDVSKHERKIDDIDKDAEITLVDETQGSNGDDIMFDVSDLAGEEVFVAEQGVPDSKKDDVAQVNTVATTISTASTIPVSAALITDVGITLAQALAELKSAKPTTATSTRPKAKGLVIHKQEQAPTPIVSSQQPSQEKIQDKGKAKMIKPEHVKKLSKKDQLKLDEEVAQRLQAEFDE